MNLHENAIMSVKSVRYLNTRRKDGYFYRSEVDNNIYFHSNDPNYDGPDFLEAEFELEGDKFCMMPYRLVAKWEPMPSLGMPWVLPKDWFKTLKKRLSKLVDSGASIEKYFYPRGFNNLTFSQRLDHNYSYYVAGTEVWRQYSTTGHIDPRWQEVLAYAAHVQAHSAMKPLVAGPGMAEALHYQIISAKSDEEVKRLIDIIKPYERGRVLYVDRWGVKAMPSFPKHYKPLKVIAA